MDSTSDKKFLMVFAVVMAVLTVIGIGVAIIANLVGSTVEYKKSEGQIELAAERIAPVGKVKLASEAGTKPVVVAAEKVASPESLYKTACAACHTTGAAGAPRLANKGDWVARLAKGQDALNNSAINGIGLMPAKGGADLSDADVKSIVQYMLDTVQ